MSQIFNPPSKLLAHWDIVDKWKNNHFHPPILVEISLSNLCNMSCPYCFYKNKHDSTQLQTGTVKRLLKDLAHIGVKAVSYTGGGEPTLHPNFDEIVEYAHELGLKQGLFTNGTNKIAHPEHFEWIRVSVPNNKLYSELQMWLGKTTVGVCMTLTHENLKDVQRIKTEAEDMGADYFQVRPALMPPGKEQLRFDKNKLFELLEGDEKLDVYLSEYKWDDYCKERGYDECYGHWFCPFVDSNGDVVSCAYHLKDPDYIFGNLYESHFEEIWNKRFWDKTLYKDSKQIKIKNCQTCCKNHEINKVLYNIKHPDKILEHVDFL